MSKTILELENISKSFDDKKTYVLRDLSFSLQKGETLSIIGLNGAGKSTLLKIIAGILKADKGKIKRNYSNLSYVPQKIDIDKTFPISVLEFVKIYNTKFDIDELKKLFNQFDSKSLLYKQIGNLSGGELQKLLIISALVSKPEIVLFDEPTAGIDLVGENIFYAVISKIRKIFPDIAIILVSHNLNLVYKNSDYIICLHKDNYCCHGTPKEEEFNKKVKDIFGEYLTTYEHNPHKKEEHR